MGGAEVCDTATRFDWISEVWVARFRGFAPTATVVPALRASEPVMPGRCVGSVNPAIPGASDSVLPWLCGAAFVGAGEAGGWVMMGECGGWSGGLYERCAWAGKKWCGCDSECWHRYAMRAVEEKEMLCTRGALRSTTSLQALMAPPSARKNVFVCPSALSGNALSGIARAGDSERLVVWVT